jgi:hypothetical protein
LQKRKTAGFGYRAAVPGSLAWRVRPPQARCAGRCRISHSRVDRSVQEVVETCTFGGARHTRGKEIDVTSGSNWETGAGRASGSRAGAVCRWRRRGVPAALVLAVCILPAGSADASRPERSSPASTNAITCSPANRIELAGNKSKRNAEGAVAPPRGSSAQLQGGSSADRYGGSSADRGGIAGARDARNRGVHQRPFNTGPSKDEEKGNKGRDQNEDDDRTQDNEEE